MSDPIVTTRSEGRGVQSIEVGAKLLTVLVDNSEPMMLKDLARQAGIAAAQAHAYLVSFRKLGLVEQAGAAGRYRLGPMALELAVARMRTSDPFRMANEAVADLTRTSRMNVALVVWGSFGPTVVQLQESGGQLNMNTRVGTVYSLTATASGRVFAAFMPEALIRETMRIEARDDHLNMRVGKSRPMSKDEMREIRESGYAAIENPPVPGINAISAPVFDHVGQLQFVVTLIGFASVLKITPDSEYIPLLLQATELLSFQLGYTKAAL